MEFPQLMDPRTETAIASTWDIKSGNFEATDVWYLEQVLSITHLKRGSMNQAIELNRINSLQWRMQLKYVYISTTNDHIPIIFIMAEKLST